MFSHQTSVIVWRLKDYGPECQLLTMALMNGLYLRAGRFEGDERVLQELVNAHVIPLAFKLKSWPRGRKGLSKLLLKIRPKLMQHGWVVTQVYSRRSCTRWKIVLPEEIIRRSRKTEEY